MKTCPNCNVQLDDAATFCANCGARISESAQAQPQYTQNTAVPPQGDPYDQTAEFDPQDISDNKVFAMLGYLLGTVGIIIALLASRKSPFTMFHVRQALKFTVVNILMLVCVALLFWTIIVPVAYGVMSCIFLVLRVICFFQICSGKAKEPAIIRSLGFLK